MTAQPVGKFLPVAQDQLLQVLVSMNPTTLWLLEIHQQPHPHSPDYDPHQQLWQEKQQRRESGITKLMEQN